MGDYFEKKVSTGNVLPGIVKTGTPPKKFENLSAFKVADVTISFMSRRRATTSSREKGGERRGGVLFSKFRTVRLC